MMNLVEAHQLPKHANLKEVLVSRCKQWLIHQTTSHAEWSNSPKLQRGGVSQTRTSGRHSQCHEPHKYLRAIWLLFQSHISLDSL
jgi:hypothetical protein